MRFGYNKYRNKPQRIDGIYFPSKKQAKRWQDLLLLEKAGQIRKLRREINFPLWVEGELVTTYRADAVYQELHNGEWKDIVEDTKGIRTREYKIKKNLLFALHRIAIRET